LRFVIFGIPALSTVLGEKTIAASALPRSDPSTNNVWVPIDLWSADISVFAGVTYVSQVDQGPSGSFLSVNWDAAEIGTYEAGSALAKDFNNNGSLVPTAADFAFRTYVATDSQKD
jgi:hypothetical protein